MAYSLGKVVNKGTNHIEDLKTIFSIEDVDDDKVADTIKTNERKKDFMTADSYNKVIKALKGLGTENFTFAKDDDNNDTTHARESVSKNDLIMGFYFNDIQKKANELMLKGDQCNSCNSCQSCDSGCQKCDKCNSTCNNSCQKCVSCQSACQLSSQSETPKKD